MIDASGKSNRRREARLGVPVGVQLIIADGPVDTVTADLSTGGAALEGNHGLDIGETVRLHIELPDGRVSVAAVVVWVGVIPGVGERCGVAFDEFAGDGEERVRAFVTDRL